MYIVLMTSACVHVELYTHIDISIDIYTHWCEHLLFVLYWSSSASRYKLHGGFWTAASQCHLIMFVGGWFLSDIWFNTIYYIIEIRLSPDSF